MPDSNAIFALRQLIARFANNFDVKDWAALKQCLASKLYTDYSDLRGTPPETMSRDRFVELRRSALHDLRTHHLSGNVEIDCADGSADVKVSMVIYRQNEDGETLNTHCLYLLGVEHSENGWVINAITQKVLMREGREAIHKGILKS